MSPHRFSVLVGIAGFVFAASCDQRASAADSKVLALFKECVRSTNEKDTWTEYMMDRAIFSEEKDDLGEMDRLNGIKYRGVLSVKLPVRAKPSNVRPNGGDWHEFEKLYFAEIRQDNVIRIAEGTYLGPGKMLCTDKEMEAKAAEAKEAAKQVQGANDRWDQAAKAAGQLLPENPQMQALLIMAINQELTPLSDFEKSLKKGYKAQISAGDTIASDGVSPVHLEPSVTSKRTSYLGINATALVVETSADWLKIKLADGTAGFIHRQFVYLPKSKG